MCIFIALYISIPVRVSEGTVIEISPGMSLDAAASRLKDEGVIRSESFFKILVILEAKEKGIREGFYKFDGRVGTPTVARRVIDGEYGIESISVTIPEGTSRKDMAAIFEKQLRGFSAAEFMAKTETKEGYLFPDTYIFLPQARTDDVITKLEETYTEKITPLQAEIERSGRTEADIIKMASILEGEARQYETRRIVAGILWKRIKDGMPLQVDAVFVYSIGKNSAELTESDLLADSPYNTYTRKGLPPTPIGNPGVESIQAALRPVSTPYYYFLTDNDGNMRYAKTHDEHVLNKRKYLD
jgi:UPF0755 protein